jgi:hypothetical protein
MGSFTMTGNRDGQKPWTEDDLFDLDSALACGGDIHDTADFLSREVARRLNERPLNAICWSQPRGDEQRPDPRKQDAAVAGLPTAALS